MNDGSLGEVALFFEAVGDTLHASGSNPGGAEMLKSGQLFDAAAVIPCNSSPGGASMLHVWSEVSSVKTLPKSAAHPVEAALDDSASLGLLLPFMEGEENNASWNFGEAF